MSEQSSNPCDPDDVICQMEVLRHLKGLQEQMGNQAFLEKYPQLANVKQQITDDIATQEVVVQEAINDCGREDQPVVEPAEGGQPEEQVSDEQPPTD